MSSKDIFRKEQRFSFRKFSFGLASAVIANVIFGGAIASSPVVHANTATETAAVATSERIASIPYTVNIVDQAGKVVDTQAKNVSVQTTEATAVATANLTTDLVPEGYALVSGLGQVTVTENAENVFTVVVEKVVSEVASTETSTSATAVASETSTVATPEPASLAATQSTPVTSEVAEAEVAPTTPEESAKPTERTAYLSYITHYVNEANETVDRTGHLVAVKTTDETAKTQVTVSASENMPSGYELVQDKAKVVVQLVENQTNILVFAVTKKSEEEEIAESQLSNRDVLTQVTSEAG
ncbi:YSIRK-type signal peptide-containing protein [Streptococcus suis]|uniref:YSIRK-type signal peptide-containing protein n=1 Tax=Streptococcus suis TaxID=1307 RepID=UPI00201670C6|nr:YSIRK-type signal peptide-containing protein [Streptococcus suis]MDY7596945.1 YSIRK-type signal peptide-containing protein [Streptococcus suis]WNF69605.1 YSIRK-type signal peptide-containing protein [Streptococcus suis]